MHHSDDSALLYHVVGAGEQLGWNDEAQLFRRLAIDDELENGGAFDRKVARLRASQDFVHVDSRTPKAVDLARCI